MVDYGKVQSTVKPDSIKMDEKSVWMHTNITETENGYEYNMTQYEKDEYINLMCGRISDVETLVLQLGGII